MPENFIKVLAQELTNSPYIGIYIVVQTYPDTTIQD